MSPFRSRLDPRGVLLGVGLLVFASTTSRAAAQIKASEHAAIEQTIDGTTIRIEYSRPGLRGRDARTELFGEQIPWGQAWTPGANAATTLDVSKDVVLAGAPVPAGRYSVWMVVNEGPWELVLDPRDELYHTAHPKPTDEQIRAPIEPTVAADPVESLTWSFPAVRASNADLRMQWGDVAVDMTLEVEPTVRLTMTADEAALYAGRWHVEAPANEYREAFEYDMDIEYVDDMLQGEMWFAADFSMRVGFVVASEQVFRTAFLMDGAVAEVDPYSFIEFTLDDTGQATVFEIRGLEDELYGRGERVR